MLCLIATEHQDVLDRLDFAQAEVLKRRMLLAFSAERAAGVGLLKVKLLTRLSDLAPDLHRFYQCLSVKPLPPWWIHLR